MGACRLLLGVVAAVLALAVLAPGLAGAYPQFQLSTGATRCNQCHYAPAGGGLINNYGREESADTISRGGNGAFLHGLWDPPDWVDLGADLRGAALVSDVGAGDDPNLAVFPMQTDVYARFGTKTWSWNMTVGMRGAARDRNSQALSYLVSREHYFMWRPKTQGPYARVGRFYIPFGLRLVEHPVYVRRYLGFDTLQEPYALSGGYVKNDWEVHASAFTPDFIRPVGYRGRGAAVYYERRLRDDKAAVGGQARVAFAPEDTRLTGGAIGKYYLEGPKVLVMGEADLVRQIFDEVEGGDQTQLATYLSATWLPVRGTMFTLGHERWDENLRVGDVARDSLFVQAHYFPMAHVEVMLYGRLVVLGGGDGGDAAKIALLQLHYYL